MNLTDRELLELAAKAAGLQNARYCPEGDGLLSCIEYDDENDCTVVWMPHLDDGDALRLAVELQLGISIPPVSDGRVEVVTFYGPIISIVEYPQNDDRQSATRRAITRAAAAIQLSKEGN